MRRKICLWVCLFFLGELLYGQTNIQDSLRTEMQRLVATESDSLRLACAAEITEWLKQLEFGAYSVDKAVKFLGYKPCSNAPVELFSWAVPLKKKTAYFHVFKFKEKRKEVVMNYLPGQSEETPPYLFYDLLAFESDKQPYFILLGWSETPKTRRKIVQIVAFGENGKPRFDCRRMRRGNSRSASLTFEYAKEAAMMLKHDRKGKRIIFDHLSPSEEKFADYPMFYGPDGDYGALELKKGEWIWREKINK